MPQSEWKCECLSPAKLNITSVGTLAFMPSSWHMMGCGPSPRAAPQRAGAAEVMTRLAWSAASGSVSLESTFREFGTPTVAKSASFTATGERFWMTDTLAELVPPRPSLTV